MKKILSFVLAVLFIFSCSGSVVATSIDADPSTTESFTFTNADGTTFYVEIETNVGSVTSKVYITDVFSQESTASLTTGISTTNIYDAEGQISCTTNASLSSMVSTPDEVISTAPASPPENNVNAIVPLPPEDDTLPNRDIHDEPVENTGLVYTFTQGGNDYYYLGAGRDAYAPTVTARIHRTYTRTDDGETHYWQWDANMTLSAIFTAIAIYNPSTTLATIIVGLLNFTVTGVLSYATSIELATYTFDYHYQVKVNNVCYFAPTRNITYWCVENSSENKKEWVQKNFNSGFSPNNQQMIRFAVEAYCDAN